MTSGRNSMTKALLWEEEDRLREAGQAIPQVFSLDDEAPHSPLSIGFDSNIKSVNLAHPDKRPDWKLVATAFEEFFADATARLFPGRYVMADKSIQLKSRKIP